MGLFQRKSKNNLLDETSADEANPPPPPQPDTSRNNVLQPPNAVICTVYEPWQRLLQTVFEEQGNLRVVDDLSQLPSGALKPKEDASAAAAATPSARRRKKKPASSCPLRIEVTNEEGRIIGASHGTSEAFDGLEDKDELVRTLQRCRCDHLELSPPSRLVNWDVTKEECFNVVGDKMPTLLGNESKDSVAVLKDPMGTSGTGVFFVRNAEEIHNIIDEHKREATSKPNFLDDLIASKGRIPSWVLQAEIRPCLMVRDRKKFHIRSYAVGVENWDIEDYLETFLYKRHEVRIAKESVPQDQLDDRLTAAHVTNGAKEIELLHTIPELSKLQGRLELFIAQIFAKHLIRDMSRRVAMGAQEEQVIDATKFVVAGLDIMVTEDGRLYLLEVNVTPAIPTLDNNSEFETHLLGFMRDLVDLVVGKPASNFVSARSIVNANGS